MATIDPFSCCSGTSEGRHTLDCPTLDDDRPTVPELPKQGERLVISLIMRAVLMNTGESEAKEKLEALKELLEQMVSKESGSTVTVEYAIAKVEW